MYHVLANNAHGMLVEKLQEILLRFLKPNMNPSRKQNRRPDGTIKFDSHPQSLRAVDLVETKNSFIVAHETAGSSDKLTM